MSQGPLGFGLDATSPGFRQARQMAALDRRLRATESQRAKAPQTAYAEATDLVSTTTASPGVDTGMGVTVNVQEGQLLSVFATADLLSNGFATASILLRGLPRWGDIRVISGNATTTAVTWASQAGSNSGLSINALNPSASNGSSWQVYPTYLTGLGSFTPGDFTIQMWLYREGGVNSAQVQTRRLWVEVR